MEFQIRTPELARALARVQGVVEKKTTMPILANVLITSKGKDAITVSATDLEIALTADYEAKVKTTGGISVGAKALFDIVRALPDGTATLKSETNGWVVITSGKVRYRVIGLNTETFPQLPKFDDVPFFDIEAKLLRLMIDSTIGCASTDETRYNLTGTFVERVEAGSGIRMVATDGHRLAMIERGLPAAPVMQAPVIIPRKGLIEANRLLDESKDNVRLGFVANSVILETAAVTLTMRLVDGKFPDYAQVVPRSCAHTMVFERRALIAAVKRVSLLAPDKGSGLAMTVPAEADEVAVVLAANNPDLGEASEELAAVHTLTPGKGLKIGLNARYLLDMLDAVSGEKVYLDLTDELSPGVVRAEDPGFKGVIMPMRIG